MVRLAAVILLLASVGFGEERPGWRLDRVIPGDTLTDVPRASDGLTATVERSDASGGRVTIEVQCEGHGGHAHRYRCAWEFRPELTRVACGDRLRIQLQVKSEESACTAVPEGAPFMQVLAGGPDAIVKGAGGAVSLDPAAFRGPASVALASPSKGSADDEVEVRVGDTPARKGRHAVLNIVVWSTRNATLHVAYLFAADPGPSPGAQAGADAERALAASVKDIPEEAPFDADGDGRVTSWDAHLLLARGARAEESAPASGGERDEEIVVPSVMGKPPAEAKLAILSARLEARFDGEVAATSRVERQDPAAGTTVRRGTRVALVLTRRPAGIRVPDVTGMTAKEAAGILSPNFQVSFEVAKAPPKDPSQAHCVIAQAPPAGASVSAGSTIVLTIHPPAAKKDTHTATGPIVPNFVGKHTKGLKAITPAGITLAFEIAADPPSCEEDAHRVLAQDRPAGKRVPQGTVVVLTISGPARRPDPALRVPSVVGLSQREAIRVLTEAGLDVTDVSGVGPAPSPEQANCVLRQRPEAGGPLPADRRMAIVCYGDYPEKHTEPPKDDPPASDDNCPQCDPRPDCLCMLGVHMDECPCTLAPGPAKKDVTPSVEPDRWVGTSTIVWSSDGDQEGQVSERFFFGYREKEGYRLKEGVMWGGIQGRVIDGVMEYKGEGDGVLHRARLVIEGDELTGEDTWEIGDKKNRSRFTLHREK